MELVDSLRRAKHAAFVVRKRARLGYRKRKFALATKAFEHVEDVSSFEYKARRYIRGRHPQPWLATDVRPDQGSELPLRVFAIWAGDNPLTEAREHNLALLRARLGVELVLVTPTSIEEWIVPGHPLHPSYSALSMIHRSDYLRGYLMHHHGGGYVDIKEPLHPWLNSLQDMRHEPDCWVTSYPTTDANWVGKLRGPIGRDLLVRHRKMFGKSGFLMRSHTPITGEWMAEMNRRLDLASDALGTSPPHDPYGGPGYPISWNDLLARVLDPLTLKHLDHVRYDDRLLLKFEGYR